MKAITLKRTLLVSAAILTLFKLWLMRGQAVFGIGGATLDDRLFLELANAVLNGNWLGQYDHLTLAKGPFYSLWMSGTCMLGIPLRLAEQTLYAAGCAVLVLALVPVIRSVWLRFWIYLIVLCNPMSWEMVVLGRTLRQNIYTPLTLMTFACAVGLMTRAGAPLKRLWGWALGLGLSFAGFWLTREESIWIMPSFGLMGLFAFYVAWNKRALRGLVSLALAALVFLSAALVPILTVCELNRRHYGWFGTVEFKAADFCDAYGALLRVTPREQYPCVPVSRETRLRIYEVSPAFAELKPYLEGELGRFSATCSEFVTGLPAERMEMAGGWFMWALREAAANAGHAKSAGEVLAFYRRMADEINAACDSGRLAGGKRRSGFLPPWREGQTTKLLSVLGEFSDYFASFRGFSAYAPASLGDDDLLELFRRITLERMSPAPGKYTGLTAREEALNAWRVKVLHGFGKALRKPLFYAILLGQALVLWLTLRAVWKKDISALLVVALAAWGGCATTLIVNAMVHVTSFPTLSVGSFAQAYPLLLIFVAAVLAETLRVFRRAGF